MVDDEIFNFLNQVYDFFEKKDITKEIIQEKIDHLTKVKEIKF